jgi:hypothetical protein
VTGKSGARDKQYPETEPVIRGFVRRLLRKPHRNVL